ncbi:MAG: hypothetical protein ACLFQQ_11350 [Desulfococcaceae bacterium]
MNGDDAQYVTVNGSAMDRRPAEVWFAEQIGGNMAGQHIAALRFKVRARDGSGRSLHGLRFRRRLPHVRPSLDFWRGDHRCAGEIPAGGKPARNLDESGRSGPRDRPPAGSPTPDVDLFDARPFGLGKGRAILWVSRSIPPGRSLPLLAARGHVFGEFVANSKALF